jgi:phosphoglycolate phosphatase
MVKAILFDKDGCLLDFDKTWGQWAFDLLEELSKGDRALFDTMSDAVGFLSASKSFDPTSAVIAGTPEDGVNLLLPHLPDWTFDSLLSLSNARAQKAPIVPVVPLAPFFDELLARGLKVGVATNDSEGAARAHMETLGIADRFAMIMGSDSGYGGKPAPGMQNAFAAHVGVETGDCVMVGDSLHDLHSGRAAGMVCVGVLSGPAPRAELEPEADVVLPDIGHLISWLDDTAKSDL